MKIKHKINPGALEPKSAVPTEEYENEVRRSTEKGERLYRRAQKRLSEAQERLKKAKKDRKRKAPRQHIAELEALVRQRREELERYEQLMTDAPAGGAQHRGTESYRPVPPPKRL